MPHPFLQPQHVGGCFELYVYDRYAQKEVVCAFESIWGLANAALWFTSFPQTFEYLNLRGFSARGTPLNLLELITWAQNRPAKRAKRWRGWHRTFVWRQGSVEGIRKWRGGGGYYRRIKTMSQRRQNALVLWDDGEVAPRAKRRKLPNSWDDIRIHRDTCWKSQRKGQKAWDRT